MLRQAIKRVTVALQPSHMIISRQSSSVSSAINSIVLKSLKEHYLEVSKLSPPPKVNPPAPFTVIKGSLDSTGPVLKRNYGEEEISLYVMRLANITSGGVGDDADESENGINQLFLHVDISKPGQKESLHFLCGLYPDAIGIHSVSMRPKLDNAASGFLHIPTKYHGPDFQDLDERMRDALHGYIEERGINEALFHFLQAWLYVKDHRNLLRWFRSIGQFVDDQKKSTVAASTG
ncbi:mitochondrial acidic protein MAM33 [Impatiens glandulifera]|uniref:mitochondrial acidic protein MAM33 n=1 Tax=Impatiens glandulifera TaxID=253017 RepID=UPI001FB18225|nr:mitochondrial acidic protein MAM33 [Impatiens glandulifera]